MDRRTFLGWIGVGTLASSFPIALAACTPRSDSTLGGASSPAASAAANGEYKVGSLSALPAEGLLVKEGIPNPVLVIRDPADTNALIAVNPTCTHQGCQVEWRSADTQFACPCHNARFDAKGAVVQGPAARPLATYTARVEGDEIFVKET